MSEVRRMRGGRPDAGLAAVVALSVLGVLGCVGLVVYGIGAALEGEQSGEVDYVAVCADPRTEARVADEQCGDTDDSPPSAGFMWFWSYTHIGASAPPVGGQINRSHGQYVRPPAHLVVQRGGVPREGGVITRAGFGGASAGGGGG